MEMKAARKAVMSAVFAVAIAGCIGLAGCASGSSSSGGSSMAASSGSGDMMASSSSSTQAAGYANISVDEAKSMIDAGNVTIVDVRTQSEYDSGHIAGAVLVPLDTIGSEQPSALPDKDANLIVYCRTGVRSAQASASLAAMGYTHVNNMQGGITAWTYGTVTGA